MAGMPQGIDAPAAPHELPDATAAETRVGALRALYAENAAFVRAAVIRLGGPDADVDDLVHDVFVVALRKLPAFEGRSSTTTWLYGIALKVVAGARRRARLRRFLGLDAAPEPADTRTPADLFEHREDSATLYRILDGISERKRAVFILYELEGMSGEQIAAVVGCPLKTVWTRLHHARREVLAAVAREAARARREVGPDAAPRREP
jgi:RNA polymerase sigma-70 factor (ECF subfamily)